jgi:ribosomal protein S18 acetylase RimI-like enzyme
MNLTIVEALPHRLAEYSQVPIGFTVTESFDDRGIATLLRGEHADPIAVPSPYWKDYDSYRDGRPTDWPNRFDVSRWTMLAAFVGARRVGGAVVIDDDPTIDLLRDCPGCGLLWDLRVAPEVRGRGIGSALLLAAEDVARQRGARALRVETQQVNVPACRLYQRHAFRLDRATHGVYAELPDEVQLLWLKVLD